MLGLRAGMDLIFTLLPFGYPRSKHALYFSIISTIHQSITPILQVLLTSSCRSRHRCRFGKIAQCFFYFFYNLGTSRDPVALDQIIWIIIRKPYCTFLIFPDKRFLRKINRRTLTAQHQGCAHFGIAKDDQFCGA